MNIVRKACEIPVRNRTEVLVVGAGPAGFGAAVSAARADSARLSPVKSATCSCTSACKPI